MKLPHSASESGWSNPESGLCAYQWNNRNQNEIFNASATTALLHRCATAPLRYCTAALLHRCTKTDTHYNITMDDSDMTSSQANIIHWYATWIGKTSAYRWQRSNQWHDLSCESYILQCVITMIYCCLRSVLWLYLRQFLSGCEMTEHNDRWGEVAGLIARSHSQVSEDDCMKRSIYYFGMRIVHRGPLNRTGVTCEVSMCKRTYHTRRPTRCPYWFPGSI